MIILIITALSFASWGFEGAKLMSLLSLWVQSQDKGMRRMGLNRHLYNRSTLEWEPTWACWLPRPRLDFRGAGLRARWSLQTAHWAREKRTQKRDRPIFAHLWHTSTTHLRNRQRAPVCPPTHSQSPQGTIRGGTRGQVWSGEPLSPQRTHRVGKTHLLWIFPHFCHCPHETGGGWAPQGKTIGDLLSTNQNSKTRIAGQLREEAGPCTDPHISCSQSQETSSTTHVQKRLLGGQRGVTSRDVLLRCLFGRIHRG